MASKTKTFGTPTRESHDSSTFYERSIYPAKKQVENRHEENVGFPENLKNRVIVGDSRKPTLIPDNSIDLTVTSPPYNVGKEYDEDLNMHEYLDFMRRVISETYRITKWGGRFAINLANLGRAPYINLVGYVGKVCEEVGFLNRGQIIWNKAASAGGSCAWGSWMSASNPTLRDVHEYILVFSKGSFGKGGKGESIISRGEFLELTKSVWEFQTESAKKIGHPAPFPVELPERLIKLYCYRGDIVYDPFMGSGTTAVAALRCGCNYIGYEVDPGYASTAMSRIDSELARLQQPSMI